MLDLEQCERLVARVLGLQLNVVEYITALGHLIRRQRELMSWSYPEVSASL